MVHNIRKHSNETNLGSMFEPLRSHVRMIAFVYCRDRIFKSVLEAQWSRAVETSIPSEVPPTLFLFKGLGLRTYFESLTFGAN